MELYENSEGSLNITNVAYEWKITDFDNKFVMGNLITSPTFSTNNVRWQIQLHPKGYEPTEDAEYISIYLATDSSRSIEAQYQLSILNSKNENFVTKQNKRPFGMANTRWGWRKFMKKSDLALHQELLPNNQLTVLCEINLNQSTHGNTPSPKCDKCNFQLFFDNQEYSDVKIITANDRRIDAHKVILMNRCPLFYKEFANSLKKYEQDTFEIANIDHSLLVEILRFIYTRQVNNLEETAAKLISFAGNFGLDELKELCEECLCRQICNNNVAEYLVIADDNNLLKLKQQSIDFIVSNMADIVDIPEFKMTMTKHPSILLEILRHSTVKNE